MKNKSNYAESSFAVHNTYRVKTRLHSCFYLETSEMQSQIRDEFDKMLVEAITEIFHDSLGDVNTSSVFQYLGSRSCPTQDIPRKLSLFSTELRALFGFGRGSMLGSAVILETAIVKTLCHKIGTKFNDTDPFVFVNFVDRLKEVYVNGKRNGKGGGKC